MYNFIFSIEVEEEGIGVEEEFVQYKKFKIINKNILV